jgi:Carboxylesterase family
MPVALAAAAASHALHGIRAATKFAPHCAQPAPPFGRVSMSENCLYLNVFTPAGQRGYDLPVMVWIHGGSFVAGQSNDYNASGLVADGVIVVTINYRLGALGFPADPAACSPRPSPKAAATLTTPCRWRARRRRVGRSRRRWAAPVRPPSAHVICQLPGSWPTRTSQAPAPILMASC